MTTGSGDPRRRHGLAHWAKRAKRNPGDVVQDQGSFRGVRALDYCSVIASTNSPDDLGKLLERRISAERFGRYRRAVAGGDQDAAALYVWNAQMASAFGLVLGQFEVILRNALDEQMVARQTTSGRCGQWYDDWVTLQDGHRHDDVAKARAQIRNTGKSETHGLIVAELMFGFWRLLLGPRHQTTLWAQSLRHAFPHLNPQRRSAVYDPVERLNKLRNRMAHHEPIYAQPLAQDHAALLEVTGYIDPEAAAWLHDISRVPLLLTTGQPWRPQYPKRKRTPHAVAGRSSSHCGGRLRRRWIRHRPRPDGPEPLSPHL